MNSLGVIAALLVAIGSLLAYFMVGKTYSAKKAAKSAVKREAKTVKEVLDVKKEVKKVSTVREEAAVAAPSSNPADKLKQLRK